MRCNKSNTDREDLFCVFLLSGYWDWLLLPPHFTLVIVRDCFLLDINFKTFWDRIWIFPKNLNTIFHLILNLNFCLYVIIHIPKCFSVWTIALISVLLSPGEKAFVQSAVHYKDTITFASVWTSSDTARSSCCRAPSADQQGYRGPPGRELSSPPSPLAHRAGTAPCEESPGCSSPPPHAPPRPCPRRRRGRCDWARDGKSGAGSGDGPAPRSKWRTSPPSDGGKDGGPGGGERLWKTDTTCNTKFFISLIYCED